MAEDFNIILLPTFGVSLAFTFATMASVSPFMFAVLSWLAFLFAVWRGMSVTSFIMYGFVVGTILTAMMNLIPYSLVIVSWLGLFFTLMIRPGQDIKPQTWIMTPLILIVIGSLAYSPYVLDFVNTPGTVFGTINGYPTDWQGCDQSCRITPSSLFISLFVSSIFAPLFTGNIVGFIQGLISSANTAISFLSVAIGIVLLLVGLGIGGGGSILGSGVTFSVNEAGTRSAQSMGITFLLYGLVAIAFGGWFTIFGGGWFGLESILPILFASVTFYGGYLQGKSVFD